MRKKRALNRYCSPNPRQGALKNSMASAPFSRGAVQRLLLQFKSHRLKLAVFSEAVGRSYIETDGLFGLTPGLSVVREER